MSKWIGLGGITLRSCWSWAQPVALCGCQYEIQPTKIPQQKKNKITNVFETVNSHISNNNNTMKIPHLAFTYMNCWITNKTILFFPLCPFWYEKKINLKINKNHLDLNETSNICSFQQSNCICKLTFRLVKNIKSKIQTITSEISKYIKKN